MLAQAGVEAAGSALDTVVPGVGTLIKSVIGGAMQMGKQHNQMTQALQQAYNETEAQTNPYSVAAYGGDLPDGYHIDPNREDHTSVPNPELGLHVPYGKYFAGGGDINIKKSKRGTFTAAAKKRGMGVQEFAGKVLSDKDQYSSAMVKKANFARNAKKWKKRYGGEIPGDFLEDLLQYAEGGWMKQGGYVEGMDDAYEFEGRSHDQGGIGVSEQGLPSDQPQAEVEGGEVIVSFVDSAGKPRKYVFSKRLTV